MGAWMWVVMAAAVLASLAIGVLVAHGLCVMMFRVFRIHARQIRSGERMAAKAAVAARLQA